MQNNKLQENKELLRRILKKGYYPLDIQEKILKNPVLKEISIYINNLCNLKCKHCSLCFPSGNQYLHKKELSVKEIVDFVKENFKQVENGVVAFAGREPFFNDKIINVISEFDKVIDSGIKFRYGIVCNGTMIQSYFPLLKKNKNLNWIDISLDGDKKTHDFIRGKGIYEKAIKSLKTLIQEKIAPYVGVSNCCHKENYSVLPEIFEKLYYEIGLKNICLLPYVYTGENEKEFISSKEDFANFFNDFINNANLQEIPLNVLFDFEWFTIPFVHELMKRKLINLDDLKLDLEGMPYILLEKGKMKIFLKFAMLEFNRFLLSADGYFGTMFMLESKEYWKLSSGNIRKTKITKDILRDALKKQFEHFNKNLKKNQKILISKSYNK